MSQRLCVLVPRDSDEEVTFAVVTANIIGNSNWGAVELLAAVRSAVAQWILATDEGRIAWERTHADFNVGDLDHYADDPSLLQFLEDEGICNLTVNTFSMSAEAATPWTFDTVLCHMEPADADDEEEASKDSG